MPSRFETEFSDYAAPALFDHFAERSVTDEFERIEYRTEESATPFAWDAILTRVEFQDDVNSRGELRRIETRKALIKRADMAADGVTSFQRKAVVTIGETEWELREIETRFADAVVTLGLQRIPLVEMGAQRGTV